MNRQRRRRCCLFLQSQKSWSSPTDSPTHGRTQVPRYLCQRLPRTTWTWASTCRPLDYLISTGGTQALKNKPLGDTSIAARPTLYLTALQPILGGFSSNLLLPCRRLAAPTCRHAPSCQYGPDSAGWHRETSCHCLAGPFMRLGLLLLDGPLRLGLHCRCFSGLSLWPHVDPVPRLGNRSS